MKDIQVTDNTMALAGPECGPEAKGVKKGRIYEAGTLRYTTAGLAVLFAWLLWGDFCYVIFEAE